MNAMNTIEGINKDVQKRIAWYADEMHKLHSDNLLSVILYGSAVDTDFKITYSNINCVLIFEMISADTLRNSLRLIDKGRKKKIVAPLFFTKGHIQTSCDAFPMEFLEMKDKHIVIYGEDVFAELQVDQKNLRLECEQQIKSMLIKLRQSYLEVGLARKGLEKMLHESFRSVLPILRSLLRLKGKEIPAGKGALIQRSAAVASLRTDVFFTLLQDKQGDEKIGTKAAIEFFDDYLKELTKLSQFIDTVV